jgi:hypothetical protein
MEMTEYDEFRRSEEQIAYNWVHKKMEKQLSTQRMKKWKFPPLSTSLKIVGHTYKAPTRATAMQTAFSVARKYSSV